MLSRVSVRRDGHRTDRIAAALVDLGIERYVVLGGDVGSSVAERLAHQHPEHVAALHLTDVPYARIFTVDGGDLGPEEQKYLHRTDPHLVPWRR